MFGDPSQNFLEPASFLKRWEMCRRTVSASRWWWTQGWSCVGPSSTGSMSPMSTTLSKARREAGKVKLPFSQNNHISKRLRVHTPEGGDGGGQGFKVFQVGRVSYISEQHGVRIWNVAKVKPWSLIHLGSMQIKIILDGLNKFDHFKSFSKTFN